ncbi:2-oxoglutarate and iron-dependent oxygenase JMJD4 isoform X2 [Venturia canescens]|uniref:2-oxoglutarate and iron-dependent oxygenase JMJD4 isoform X2 n=1 Tax=Venturia canescens TaxID=32260 RepID=UPI001C9BDB9D|nr:2-oxoglutarate and iron-dependent oxygenase JMJD4 isoform X2 [Venturia canescens]
MKIRMKNQSERNCKAPVADCNKQYYNCQLKNDMTIKNYIDYWIEYREKNYPSDMDVLYLKDWHCVKEYKNLFLYSVPKFFASDWLNEYYIAHPELKDDYMFVYMGPKGTWTPFHADVFTSYSWSANIVGKKKWLLFPPGEENTLRDSHGQLCFDASTDALLENSLKYQNFNENTSKSFEIIQNEGEIIFVPSGWHHQVWNLEDTISVNHNWINGCNVWNSWQSMRNELSAVMREVADCREMDDWENHCQLMLGSSYGMNYRQFYKFLSFIVTERLNVLKKGVEAYRSFEKWKIGPQHCYFDLNQAKIVLTSIIDDSKEKGIYELVFSTDPVDDLLDEINNVCILKFK